LDGCLDELADTNKSDRWLPLDKLASDRCPSNTQLNGASPIMPQSNSVATKYRKVEYNECPNYGKGSGGYVYLGQCQEFHKIGMTKNLKKRVCNLNTSSPHGFELIAYFESQNARLDERRLHSLMKKYHYRLEWYKLPTTKTKDLSWFVTSDPSPVALIDPRDSAAMMVLGFSSAKVELLYGVNSQDAQRLIECAEEQLDPDLCILRAIARAHGYPEKWVQWQLTDLKRLEAEECRDACSESGEQVKKALD
jgi:hypothetical protein